MAKQILILSSSPEIIQRLRATLEPEGYMVTVLAADAEVAEEVARCRPDVVILAAGLAEPELRVYENQNMKRLGGSSSLDRPRVLVLSSRDQGEFKLEYDGDMYLVERFVPAELLASVRRLMWMHIIRRGEDAMLDGYYNDAEQYYLAALAQAKSASPEDRGWYKTIANLRYLYVNYLCVRPLSPDILLERTVPVWEPVLGQEHYFIKRWVMYVEQWRKTLSEDRDEVRQQAEGV